MKIEMAIDYIEWHNVNGCLADEMLLSHLGAFVAWGIVSYHIQ